MKKLFTLSIFFVASFTIMNAQVWEGKSAGFPYFLSGGSVYAIDENVAWTWGLEYDTNFVETSQNNAISVTTDAGLTWTNVNFPYEDNTYPSSIYARDSQTAWVTYVEYFNGVQGESAVVKTDDGGQSWSEVNVNVSTFVDFIYMWDEMEGIVVGDPDAEGFEIFRTVDGGLTWDRMNGIPFAPENEILFADNYAVYNDQLWFATSTGRIFYTTDRGSTWSAWDSPFTGFGAWAMDVSDDGDAYITFYRYLGETVPPHLYLYRRNADDGQWVNLTQNNGGYYLYDLIAIPGTDVLMMTINDYWDRGPETQISYDKGVSWQEVEVGIPAKSLSFYNPQIGYATQQIIITGTTESLMFRYIGSPLSGLIKNTPLQNVDISISPNPTSDIAVISLQSSSTDNYWILLHDISGTLLYKKEILSAAEFVEEIDMKLLPAGTYTVTVSNAKGMRTEKLIRL